VRRALVVAAERRRGAPGSAIEALGAGGVAVLVEANGAAPVTHHASARHGVPTRWRPDGGDVLRHYDDSRYELVGQLQPALEAALASLGLADLSFCALGPLDRRGLANLARGAGVKVPTGTDEVESVGDLGAAAPLLALAHCLDQAASDGGRGVVAALEPGSGAIALGIELAGSVPVVHRRPPAEAVGPSSPDPIVPHAASPGAARDDAEGSLAGGRCLACGSLNTPPRPTCIDCGKSEFRIERAPRRGRVVTYNAQHIVAVAPEPAPVAVGVLRFEGEGGERGGQVSAMFCDTPLDELRVGLEVELVYRRLGVDDGLVKYGWKARALPGTSAVGADGEEER